LDSLNGGAAVLDSEVSTKKSGGIGQAGVNKNENSYRTVSELHLNTYPIAWTLLLQQRIKISLDLVST
jgi:hypothetical protein